MTSPKSLRFEKKSRDNEAIFLNQYDWLLDWARQLTQGRLGEAEDLVQDLYIRFVQIKSGPTFTDQDQIRGYLYKSLKNLYISRKLRYGRDAISGLLAVDFDSVEFAMQGIDRSELLHVRGDLAAICEYVCVRRKTNRAAAALIFRFFLGYLPTEVMSLLRTNRSTVDALIQTARLEAKAYLNRPGVLRFLPRGERKAPSFPRYLPEQPEALFAELQRRIFSETEGTCLPSAELQDRYARPDASTFSTQEIAHLASCRECLNRASRLLGLPDLLLRFFSEGESQKGKTPPAAQAEEEGLKKLRRKLRETYEHRPKKLQIAVDGEVRGVQTITGAHSKLQIKLAALSQPGFVEVFSEQGIGMLYFDLQQETVEVPAPQIAAVDLSDGRHLSIAMTLVEGAPVIDVAYYDPLLEAGLDGPPSAQAPLTDLADSSADPEEQPTQREFVKSGWIHRLFSMFRKRHGWTIAMAVGLCAFILMVLALTRMPSPVKQQLTSTAVVRESMERTALGLQPHGAIHQIFSLEIRSGEGKPITDIEVDSLRSSDRP